MALSGGRSDWPRRAAWDQADRLTFPPPAIDPTSLPALSRATRLAGMPADNEPDLLSRPVMRAGLLVSNRSPCATEAPVNATKFVSARSRVRTLPARTPRAIARPLAT